MPDRADFIARTLLTRLADRVRDEPPVSISAPDIPFDLKEALVTKVLAVELGVTDSATLQAIAQALPRLTASRPATDRDANELAAYVRKRLAAFLDT